MANQDFITLPVETWDRISRMVHKSDQSRLRQVSSHFNSFRPTVPLCCSTPTSFELATFLFDPNITFFIRSHTILKLTNNRAIEIHANGISHGVYYLGHQRLTFGFFVRSDIIDFMNGAFLDYTYYNTWNMIRYLFHQRDICKKHGINPDQCYIQFLADNLPNTSIAIQYLQVAVKPQTFNTISKEFLQTFPDTLIFFISKHEKKHLKVEWLKHQLQQLKPTDLTSL